ncbi:MAG: hypothetical protein OEV42_19430 [Deltaproteobacteria bacterium]|nr:hypothetical protein [Deltaproteobacteria bacterium]
MEIMSDRELNRLGARFRLKKVLIRLHVPFIQYLNDPARYDKIIGFIDNNKAIEPLINYGGRRVLH